MGRRSLDGAGSEIDKIHQFVIQHLSRIYKESEFHRRYRSKKPRVSEGETGLQLKCSGSIDPRGRSLRRQVWLLLRGSPW